MSLLYDTPLLFADDFKIFKSILNIDDRVKLQTDMWNVVFQTRREYFAVRNAMHTCFSFRLSDYFN